MSIDILNASGYPARNGNSGDFVRVTTADGEKIFCWSYWDASDPSACAKGQVVTVTKGQNGYTIAAVPTSRTESYGFPYTGVATKALTEAGYLWVQIKGKCQALVTGVSSLSAAGKTLKTTNGVTAFVYDGASYGANTIAIIQEAWVTTSVGLKWVTLVGDKNVVT